MFRFLRLSVLFLLLPAAALADFPNVSVVDDFNCGSSCADGTLVKNDGSSFWDSTSTDAVIYSNAMTCPTIAVCYAVSASNYDADQEIYFTITSTTPPPTYQYWLSLYMRVAANGANWDYYRVQLHIQPEGVGNDVHIYKVVNSGTPTELGVGTNFTVVTGDSLGIQVSGSSSTAIAFWRKTSGTWGSVYAETDSSSPLTAGGGIQMGMDEADDGGSPSAFRFDDLGAGNSTGAPTVTVHRRGRIF